MFSYLRHLPQQWPVIQALAQSAVQSLQRPTKQGDPAVPSAWHEMTLPPRPPALIRDLITWSGGDPLAYNGALPPYLFPQWSFPQIAAVMRQLPYPLTRILNAGCDLTLHQPLPANEPIFLRSRLLAIEETDSSKRFTVEIESGTQTAPAALHALLKTYLPLAKKPYPSAKKERPRIPLDAKELRYLRLAPDAGGDFALLTGDINPIHWFAPYAKLAGFRGCILHGFASLALVYEAFARARCAGRPHAIQRLNIRFSRPLRLPARVGIYTTPHDNAIFLGDAPGAPPYLQGSITLHS